MPREDPHPNLFREYEATLSKLASGAEQAPVLRRYELRLLAELGYALPLTHEVDTGRPIDPEARYYYAFDRGPRLTAEEPAQRYPLVRGATLLALARQDFSAPDAAVEAKRLMREVLDHYLERRAVISRRVVRDLQALEEEEGKKLWDSNDPILVLVWESDSALIAGDQPFILKSRRTASNAGPNSQVAGNNQADSPMEGFKAVILDELKLAGMQKSQAPWTMERVTSDDGTRQNQLPLTAPHASPAAAPGAASHCYPGRPACTDHTANHPRW